MLPLAPNVIEPPATVSTVRVLIVDDEPLARDCMRLALRGAAGVDLVAECCDGASALDAIRHHTPDIVFLDVQMPGLDGFAVLDRIEPSLMPVVVFVTVPVSEPTAVAWRGAGCCATARAPTAPATTVTAVTSAVEVRRMRRNAAVGEEASVLPVPEPFDPSLA